MTAPNPPRPITIRKEAWWVLRYPHLTKPGWAVENEWPTWGEAMDEADKAADWLRESFDE